MASTLSGGFAERSAEHRLGACALDRFEPGRCPALQGDGNCPLDFISFSRRNARMITRRDLVVAAVSAFVAVAGIAVMRSSVFNWADLKVTPTKQGERRTVCDAPTPALANFECHITTLNPGESPHPPHRHADEELMVIKEGTLEALQGDQTNIVTAGGIIFEASNEFHGLRNIGTNRATYFVFRFSPHDLQK